MITKQNNGVQVMTDFDDIELAGLTAAELEELSEFIDPDVRTYSTVQVAIALPVLS